MTNLSNELINKANAIGALSTTEEKQALWDLANEYIVPGSVAVEIGTWTGGSAVIIGEVCKQKGARLLCVDGYSADMNHGGVDYYIQTSAFDSVVNNTRGLPVDFLVGDTNTVLWYLRDQLSEMVYVDAGHFNPYVAKDIELALTLVSKPGVLCGHDYVDWVDVKKEVDKQVGPIETRGTIWIKRYD